MSNTVDILVPDSEEGGEATVIAWMKEPGDDVVEHEPLLELSTDKVTIEVSAPASGRLQDVLCQSNDVVHPGAILGRIQSAEIGSETIPPVEPGTATDTEINWTDPNPEEFSGFRLSPLVKRMLREHGISPSDVQGSGREGRITHRDVLAHISGPDAIEDSATADESDNGGYEEAESVAEHASADIPGHATAHTPESDQAVRESIRVPHSTMRKSIAAHMVDSMLRTAPHVTSLSDADLSAVLAHKSANSEESERRGIRLTLTSYFVKAAAIAAQSVPQVNSRWHDDAVEIFPTVNVGLATSLGDEGLIVPVIKRAHTLGLWETAKRVEDLTARARMGSLTKADVNGGTLTITNHGVSGSLIATPIINQPQSAILGIGKLEKRVKVVSISERDTIQIQPMVYVTLTIDHRVLDGHQANRFLDTFVKTLEAWA